MSNRKVNCTLWLLALSAITHSKAFANDHNDSFSTWTQHSSGWMTTDNRQEHDDTHNNTIGMGETNRSILRRMGAKDSYGDLFLPINDRCNGNIRSVTWNDTVIEQFEQASSHTSSSNTFSPHNSPLRRNAYYYGFISHHNVPMTRNYSPGLLTIFIPCCSLTSAYVVIALAYASGYI